MTIFDYEEKQQGLTLVEIAVSIAIVGILALGISSLNSNIIQSTFKLSAMQDQAQFRSIVFRQFKSLYETRTIGSDLTLDWRKTPESKARFIGFTRDLDTGIEEITFETFCKKNDTKIVLPEACDLKCSVGYAPQVRVTKKVDPEIAEKAFPDNSSSKLLGMALCVEEHTNHIELEIHSFSAEGGDPNRVIARKSIPKRAFLESSFHLVP